MLVLFIVSFLIISTGAVYKKMQEIFLTEPLIAMVAGIIFGPYVLEIIQPESHNKLQILKTTCEFTIAVALMATALRIQKNFFFKNFLSQTTIVIGGMILMWLSSSYILYLIFDILSIQECLLIGAIITPTDPVIAATIVSGDKAKKYLPSSIRNSISFESGINDGLAYPLVLFGIFLLNNKNFPQEKWLTQTVLYETVLCCIIAYGVGHIAGLVMRKAHKSGIMTTKAVLPYSLGLGFLLLSGLNLLHMNGIIAVFVGGLAFARIIADNEDIEEERVQESMERITTIPAFFLFGLLLPWAGWFSMGWIAVILVVLILFFRRIPAFLAMVPFLPQFKGKIKDALIMGWFGPVGVAAIYYAIHAEEKSFLQDAWIIPSLIVFSSTVVHGITSLPLEEFYHNKKGSQEEKEKEEEQEKESMNENFFESK